MRRRKNTDNKRSASPPGRLRIVAGKWRGRVLPVADVEGLRPTGARVRETVFNWLAPHLPGARCLDLFAGTGALGLEALSRGAADVVFVESNRLAVRALEAAVATLKASDADVVSADAGRWLAAFDRDPFDIVFLDPPYATDSIGELCTLLSLHDVTAAGASVYFEQRRSQAEPALPAGWIIKKNKTAGQVRYVLAVTPQS